MRKDQLLTAIPPAPVRSLIELYVIAFDLADKAARRYGDLAERTDESFWPVRCVFEVLTARERDRADDLLAACIKACGRRPEPSDLRWAPLDLVPADELADIGKSDVATPYAAWALAVRHRQRAFVFWTYVIALAEDPEVRRTAEDLAHEALRDGNLLRRERRIAWRQEREAARETNGMDAPASAALLESLLLKDMIAWSRRLPEPQRAQLLTLQSGSLAEQDLPEGDEGAEPAGSIEEIRRRALQRAEQLSDIYLAEADRAADQDSMELAQKLAAQSIMRLAGLRSVAQAERRATAAT